jgi:hypothetical protein
MESCVYALAAAGLTGDSPRGRVPGFGTPATWAAGGCAGGYRTAYIGRWEIKRSISLVVGRSSV